MPVNLPGKQCSFIQTQNENLITHDELWYSMMTEAMRILAYQNNRLTHFTEVRNQVVLSKDVATTVDLINYSQSLVENGNTKGKEKLRNILEGLISYLLDVRLRELAAVDTFDQYLSYNSLKISQLMADFINQITEEETNSASGLYLIPPDEDQFENGVPLQNISTTSLPISASNIFPEGFWELDYTIGTPDMAGVKYHFLLEISDQEDYSNILLTKDTRVSTDNWLLEIKNNTFDELSEYIKTDGLGDNFADMTLRYQSSVSDYLTRGSVYYFRIYQISENGTFGPTEFEDIIYT